MNNKKITIEIWGRTFELPVKFDCFPGEEITDTQNKAFEVFCDSEKAIEDSKTAVEQYIIDHDSDYLDKAGVDNIFRFVKPKSIYIPRRNPDLSVAILCNYKFDMEHGIAVVISNGKYKSVVAQDMVL